MKKFKPLLLAASIAAFSQPSHALFGVGDIVHDPVTMTATLVEMAKSYGIETKQLNQLVQQLITMKNMYDTLQNDPVSAIKREAFNQMMSRLPPEFSALINGGGNFGNWQGIAEDNRIYDIANAPIEQTEELVKQFEENRLMVAKHAGTFRQLVEDSDFNFQNIGALIDKMKQAETVGEKLDNIAESNLINATLLNQIVKNQATAESYKAEQELASQRQKEVSLSQNNGRWVKWENTHRRTPLITNAPLLNNDDNIMEDQF